ncbi:MAG: fatty acid desaturase [Candidatus Krumholzibacteriia bacterium]
MPTTPTEFPGLPAPRELTPYQRPSLRRSLLQLADSVLPYLALWALMIWSLRISPWLTLALTVPTAGFLVRTFIIFHDCGHGSFFRAKWANEVVGFITGVLTLTPAHDWWRQHAKHHATAGNLDRRGDGDVWTLTVEEWRQAPRWKRVAYWCMRQPLFMLTVGPILMFVVLGRFPSRGARRREVLSVLGTNLALVVIVGTLILTLGWRHYLLIHVPVTLLSGAMGIWLFYVQHQFVGVYWQRRGDWNPQVAAVAGSSYFRLPRILQWFSGNIGFHHVHHLSARIPNYYLERCHRDHPVLQKAPTLGLAESVRCFRFRLWDEGRQRLVGFREVRRPQGLA